MGERLNLEICAGENVYANAYYHWSGYTSSAIQLTNCALKLCPQNFNFHSVFFDAIKMLENTGARLTKSEYSAYSSIVVRNILGNEIPKPKAIQENCNRNSGLISITSYGIAETRMWEESRVTIDIKSKSICFGAVWMVDNEDEDSEPKQFPNIGNWNNLIIPIDEFNHFSDKINALIGEKTYQFSCGGKKYYMKE